jgi:putative addiction module killer protein
VFEITEYQTASGKIPFREWLANLDDLIASARIDARLLRLSGGLFGDCKPIGDGVWELRIDHGPGYRVYYALSGRRVVLLLIGGSKRTQTADIATAIDYLKDFTERTE